MSTLEVMYTVNATYLLIHTQIHAHVVHVLLKLKMNQMTFHRFITPCYEAESSPECTVVFITFKVTASQIEYHMV